MKTEGFITMPSFDVVSEIDKPELNNAVHQANKELSTRFDFKGTDARVETSDAALTAVSYTHLTLPTTRRV